MSTSYSSSPIPGVRPSSSAKPPNISSNTNNANQDLFGNLVSFGSASKGNPLTLEEQRKQQSQQPKSAPMQMPMGQPIRPMYSTQPLSSTGNPTGMNYRPVMGIGSGSPVPVQNTAPLVGLGMSGIRPTPAGSNTMQSAFADLSLLGKSSLSSTSSSPVPPMRPHAQQPALANFSPIGSSNSSPARPMMNPSASMTASASPSPSKYQDAFASLLNPIPASQLTPSNLIPTQLAVPPIVSSQPINPTSIASSSPNKVNNANTWGDLDFLGGTVTKQSTIQQQGDIFDVDYLNKSTQPIRHEPDEDPILGLLAQPISHSQHATTLTRQSSAHSSTTSDRFSIRQKQTKRVSFHESVDMEEVSHLRRHQKEKSVSPPLSPKERQSPSPPPSKKILKQGPSDKQKVEAVSEIVIMGFDREAAILALQMNDYNVSEAVDMLVQQKDRMSAVTSPHSVSFGSPSSSPSRRPDTTGSSGAKPIVPEKVIESASAFGLSVLKNAKTAFEFSKKKINQVIEKAKEDGILGVADSSAFNSKSNRREDDDNYREAYEKWHSYNGFRDNDGNEHREEEHEEPFTRSPDISAGVSKEPVPIPPQKKNQPQPAVEENLLDFGTHEQPRKQPVTVTNTQSTFVPVQSAKPTAVPITKSTPKSTPIAALSSVAASPAQLDLSAKEKDLGNDLFKKGQFGDAEIHYSKAIDALPPGHDLLSTLYNNRAASRLKTGHYKEAIEDCSRVQTMQPQEPKSLLRRAMAYEALEKWEDAREDYRVLMTIDASTKGVSLGLSRCNKALNPDQGAAVASSSISSASKTSAVSLPSASQSTTTYVKRAVDAAVSKVREQNDMLEKEEAMKLALKDQVDDRILQWRKGKEDNLRALLSSLDTVLWAELELKKISLSELITPQQVKIKYLKTVGKLHPDKIGMDTSIEHRLIANNVFAALNKAWDSFKAQNNL